MTNRQQQQQQQQQQEIIALSSLSLVLATTDMVRYKQTSNHNYYSSFSFSSSSSSSSPSSSSSFNNHTNNHNNNHNNHNNHNTNNNENSTSSFKKSIKSFKHHNHFVYLSIFIILFLILIFTIPPSYGQMSLTKNTNKPPRVINNNNNNQNNNNYYNNNENGVNIKPIPITKNTIDNREAESVLWLSKQYGLGIKDIVAAKEVCLRNIVGFKCDSRPNNRYHVLEINLEGLLEFSYSGIPNPTIKYLYFPELSKLTIISPKVQNPSINLLDLVGDLPKLTHFQLRNQKRQYLIPNNFLETSKNLNLVIIGNDGTNVPAIFNKIRFPLLNHIELFNVHEPIPDGFGWGLKIDVSVTLQPNIAFNLPDSLCSVQSLKYTAFSPDEMVNVASCFQCYSTIPQRRISVSHLEPNSECVVQITDIRFNGTRVIIHGNNLGWAFEGDTIPNTLDSVIPNQMLQYQRSELSFNRLDEVITFSKNLGISERISLTRINLEDATAIQSAYGLMVTIFVNFNTYIEHTVMFDQFECFNGQYDGIRVYTCQVSITYPRGQYEIVVSNSRESASKRISLELDFPIVKSSNIIPQTGGMVTLDGHFGFIKKHVAVEINQQCCRIRLANWTTLICELGPTTPGPADLVVSVDGYLYESSRIVNIIPSLPLSPTRIPISSQQPQQPNASTTKTTKDGSISNPIDSNHHHLSSQQQEQEQEQQEQQKQLIFGLPIYHVVLFEVIGVTFLVLLFMLSRARLKSKRTD
ncbi:hypothetical protein DFA_08151 [Cavenderia fasciculata]|uniref:IPT/TIG domain-containing protein n=1 Tax=Cavenderia fasciculata TaxID=261658 RepID=F4Q5A8_CACFS|nr:uncharacterized protein DFA_08151 [Cavenderia fasciculata]EGG17167.1 hypothetical protein DFA_08151 [Cavenderia fasciculata]|eukprot:XP_004355651.1 hypothetical protein DFA_08151 [Cavenderia fasciculata]